MSEDLNKVRLVLPIGPGVPLVEIDGAAVKGVVAAQIEHNPQAGTVLHLSLVADIACETAALDEEAPADDDPEDDWEDIGGLGPVIYQRNRKTGEQRKVPRSASEGHRPLT